MANIMSMKSVKNRPSRSGYDLSRRTCFTAKVGELLPVWWNYVLPFDNYEIDLSSFARTLPVNTASFGRIVEYYDFFFVPLDQLWNRASTTMTQMLNNVQHASSLESLTTLDGSHPHLSSLKTFNDVMDTLDDDVNMKKNMFGFSRSAASTKLLSYLGYGQPNFEHYYGSSSSKPSTFGNRLFYNTGSVSLPNVCVYPLLAYQKIYADFFRYTQWERSNPSTFNVDWMTGSGDTELQSSQFTDFSGYTMFDLRYCNYQKDLFHGVLPNAQYGETAAVPLIGGQTVRADVSNFGFSGTDSVSANTSLKTLSALSAVSGSTTGLGVSTSTGSKRQLDSMDITLPDSGTFSILALRQAEALQKWKEISQAAEEDYKQQIQAHWGQPVSDFLSGMCTYLGGHSSTVSVNEVVNTNLVQGNTDQPAELAGKGINSVNGKISFSSNGQYGVIMCIYHALPLLDYITSGTDMKLLHVEASSFPIPEMDSIGMELLPTVSFLNNGYLSHVGSGDDSLGYVPRYVDWKTDYDRCVGDFANTYQSWILPYSDTNSQKYVTGPVEDSNPNVSTLFKSSFAFFKVNPSIVDPMFAASMTDELDTDPLRCQAFIKAYCSRLLDPNGLPY